MSEEVTAVEEIVELDYEWPYGKWGTQFFERILEEGEFSGTKCPECGSVHVRPQSFCTLCFTEVEPDNVPVEDTGTVNMWTEVHMPFPGQPTEPPYIWVFVDLDGADTSMTHVMGNVEAEEMEIGMEVQAVWRDEDDREGTLDDIRFFEPVDG